jgi:hypothetical protein
MRFRQYLILSLIGLVVFIPPAAAAASQTAGETPVVVEMTLEQKRAVRKELLSQMIAKYRQNQIFQQMQAFMTAKYAEMHKSSTPKPPDQLIIDTMERSRTVYEKTRSFVGENFKRVYEPARIESSVNRFLWLKGLCFVVLGINEDHKVALSFFYMPGNEQYRQEFLRDTVKYSFPEVQNIPVNDPWFDDMGGVMDRLAYKIFNVDKYSATPPSAVASAKTKPAPIP